MTHDATTDPTLVSVVIPTYEDEQYLRGAIDSVLQQSVVDGPARRSALDVDVEVIVVDSSESTAVREIAEEYDDRVRYEWVEPAGAGAARNHGIDLASGDVIGFCDADDFWHPEKLAHQLPPLADGADLVYADEYLLTEAGRAYLASPPVEDPDRHHVAYFRRGGGVGSRSVLARRACFERERFDESFTMREDPHLWTRLFAEFTPARVDEALTYKRRRAGSLTADRDEAFAMQRREIEDLVDRYPELEPYREQRLADARLLYAKSLLVTANRPRDARVELVALATSGHVSIRVVALLVLSFVPRRPDAAIRAAQGLYWRAKRWLGALPRPGGSEG